MNGLQFLDNIEYVYDSSNGLEQLRGLVLQLAIQGKLSEQSSDEEIDIYLKQLHDEKNKLRKRAATAKRRTVYLNHEKPFSIPVNWEWVRIDDISEDVHYGYTAKADPSISNIKYLRITDIQKEKVDWDSVPGCRINEKQYEANRLRNGDLLIARTGGYPFGELRVFFAG